jgi:TM2 domain-containing membrane protein YozV
MTEKLKNPVTAKYLSFFCPGLGQFYASRWLRGIGIFCITIPLCFVLIGFWIWKWNIEDAVAVAELYNDRALMKTVEKNKV